MESSNYTATTKVAPAVTRLILCILTPALLTYFPKIAFGQREWTNETGVLSAMKLDPDLRAPDHELDNYIKATSPETWKRIEGSEFGLRRERKTLLEKIERKISAFDLAGEFVLRTHATIREYDFNENAFPIAEHRSNHDWKVARDPTWNIDSYPPTVRFANADLFKWMRLEPDIAEKFLESRMDEKGRPNRKLKVDLVFRPKRSSSSWGSKTVIAELVAFRFYGDDERKKVVYEFPQRRNPNKPAITAEAVLREVEGENTPLNDAKK